MRPEDAAGRRSHDSYFSNDAKRLLSMPVKEFIYRSCLLLLLSGIAAESQAASDFGTFVKPLFAENCTRCHGKEEANGEVNLEEITTANQRRATGRRALTNQTIGRRSM